MSGRIARFDYDQLEPRVMAHVAGDERLIECFRKGEDIYALVGSEIWDVPMKEMHKEHPKRKDAKPVVLGMNYGLTEYGLSARLGCSVDEAKDVIRRYLKKFSGVKGYMGMVERQLRKEKRSVSIFHNIRHLPYPKNDDYAFDRAFRQAVNHPIQSAASDMTLSAVVAIEKELAKRKLRSVLVAEVHDELVYDCPEEEVPEIVGLVKHWMAHPPILKRYGIELSVPLSASETVAEAWQVDAN